VLSNQAAEVAADRAAIIGMVRAFLAAFTSGPGPECAARLDALRKLFLPEALIVRTCGDLTAYRVDTFIARSRRAHRSPATA
jgi:hypothetical protein